MDTLKEPAKYLYETSKKDIEEYKKNYISRKKEEFYKIKLVNKNNFPEEKLNKKYEKEAEQMAYFTTIRNMQYAIDKLVDYKNLYETNNKQLQEINIFNVQQIAMSYVNKNHK